MRPLGRSTRARNPSSPATAMPAVGGEHGRIHLWRPARDRQRAPRERTGVDHAHAAALCRHERAAVAADRGGGEEPVPAGIPDAAAGGERTPESPVADQVPADDAAVEAGGVQRAPALVHRGREHASRVPGERLADRAPLDVPDQCAVVVSDRDQEVAVACEQRRGDRAVVAPGRGRGRARAQVDDAHGAVVPARGERGAVGRERDRVREPQVDVAAWLRSGNTAVPGARCSARSVRASRSTSSSSSRVTNRRPSAPKASRSGVRTPGANRSALPTGRPSRAAKRSMVSGPSRSNTHA